MTFERLFSPLPLRGVTLRNRIFSTGHMTNLVQDGSPSADLVAYHEARARGGVGLIIMESARVHASSISDQPAINASVDACIPGFTAVADAVKGEGAAVFGQLGHAGRVTYAMRRGARLVAYAPSCSPDDRFHTTPRAMPTDMVAELVASFGTAAGRYRTAGLDGAEIMASHGLLAAQFLNPRVNRREDRYGGSFENRLRFLRECLAAARAAMGPEMTLGIRISADEMEDGGLTSAEVVDICQSLAQDGDMDYLNVTAGSMAGLAGSVHVVPPMQIAHGYVAPLAAAMKAAVSLPVFVAGRINQPQIAEGILAAGQADLCGMTRAMIADPEMPNKARAGRLDDIRACIGCNQACIGHMQMGVGISCIQHPETGRERIYDVPSSVPVAAKKVLVAGGGPAGMKAAAVAAARGHRVLLCEAGAQLGGQVLLAQSLPDRGEFGGLVTNLAREMTLAGVEVRLKQPVDAALVAAEAPDAVVIASGAQPRAVAVEGQDEAHVLEAWQVLRGEANPGQRVLLADWRSDWIGLGLAEKLALDGCHVRLAVNGPYAGQELQMYLRDHWVGRLHKLGVEIIPYAQIYGADADTVYLRHSASGEAIICEGVDSLVLAQGHSPDTRLEDALSAGEVPLYLAGDCLAPRSAEEAVLEGLEAGRAV